MVSNLLDLLFFAVKKESFPQSRKFSTKYLTMEIFHSQVRFSTKYLIKDVFRIQGIFHKKYDQRKFQQKILSKTCPTKRFSKSENFRSIQYYISCKSI